MSNQARYLELRQQHPCFSYQSYHYQWSDQGLHLSFRFTIGPDILFEPTAMLPSRDFYHQLTPQQMDTLVFNIGMIELISYWKCCCPPTVQVLCGSLTASQIAFWKKIYYNGLGEFFYINGIHATIHDFMEIQSQPQRDTQTIHQQSTTTHNGYLVPIGGGKDSVVTLELLRRNGHSIRPVIMNPRGATIECAQVAGFPIQEVAVVNRTIHPLLLQLNKEGYLNGHTPFSAMLAFYTMLISALTGIPNVALSNESSANESTVVGTNVNHQYSKSLEFEDDFRQYLSAHLQPHVGTPLRYFSFLRPLCELQIASLFAQQTAYHDIFRSCNVGSKQDIWCGHCPKCLFAYIILSPFLSPQRLTTIFGHPLLDDPALHAAFLQLIGQAETKPFECVGTIHEVQEALSLTLLRWYPSTPAHQLPLLLQQFRPTDPVINLALLSPYHNLTAAETAILTQALSLKA